MIFAPGFLNDASKSNLASDLLRITFPYIFFISLTAFAGSILNTYKNFATKVSSDFGFGYRYKILNNSGIILEMHNNSPINIPEDVAIFNIMPPREKSFHFGNYYQIRNSKIGYWNNLNMQFSHH